MRGDQRLNWFIACISIFLTTIVACTFGDIYIRFSKPYITPDTVRANSLEYQASLFARYVFPQREQNKREESNREVYINERGYRGHTFTVPKPEGVTRIVFLGGSAAFDVYASEGQDWPHLVEKELQVCGFKNVEIINAGTPGHATWDSLGRLYSEIWMLEPDYIVVYHGWNDIKYFSSLSQEKSLLRSQHPPPTYGTSKEWLVQNPFMYYTNSTDQLLSHSQLYVRLRTRYWKWHLGKIGLEGAVTEQEASDKENGQELEQKGYQDHYSEWGPRQFELDLRLIADAAYDIDAIPIFLTQARLVTAENNIEEKAKIKYDFVNLSHEALVQAYADTDKAIFNAAQMEGVALLDLSEKFTGQSELFVDHVHTTPQGSRAIAKAVADFLAGIIEKEQGSDFSK